MNNSSTKKVGSFKRSWSLLKSSWRVFRLDKELTIFPLFTASATIALLAAGAGALFFFNGVELMASKDTVEFQNNLGYFLAPVLLVTYIIINFIVNFFGAAILSGALERFRGGNPTIKGSLKIAAKRWKALFLFSIVMGTIGLALDYLQQRLSAVPGVGGFLAQLMVSLAGFAWAVANFFSVAHIVTSEVDISPLTATKESVGTIKRVWGESVVTNAGLGIATGIITIIYLIIGVSATATTAIAGQIFTAGAIGIVSFVGLIGIILVSETLGAILKAAIFHYATTGEAPEAFDRELLKTSMTPKKARKIFGDTKKDKTWA